VTLEPLGSWREAWTRSGGVAGQYALGGGGVIAPAAGQGCAAPSVDGS